MKVHNIAPEIDTAPLPIWRMQFASTRSAIDLEGRTVDARNAAERMMNHSPAWIEALLTLRHVLVAPFGLKTSGKSETPATRETIGLFPILTQTPQDRLVAQRHQQLVSGFPRRGRRRGFRQTKMRQSHGRSPATVKTLGAVSQLRLDRSDAARDVISCRFVASRVVPRAMLRKVALPVDSQ